MMRVFVDTSVLFSAVYSSTGFARDLLQLSLDDQIQLIVSQNVLAEVERNLQAKIPEYLDRWRRFLNVLQLEIVADPPLEQVRLCEAYVVQKDAPIVAAAIIAKVDYLVTYDRKHLLEPPEVAKQSGLTIVMPDKIVMQFKS
jgi:putative PIN family toxin of toxin-antitoxin system